MLELLSNAEMRAGDAAAIAAGTPGRVLMERAGRAVARTVGRAAGPGARVLVLCGPGNNGGDGFVAARVLAGRGFRVELALLGQQEALKGDAAAAAGDWDGRVGLPDFAVIDEAHVIVDALFGAGLARELEGEAQAVVQRINDSDRPVVAVDVPSGIDGDSGQVRGGAVRASRTVTFVRRKPGHLLLPGRLHCGEVEVADIGIADAVVADIGCKTWSNDPSLWRHVLAIPSVGSHKYSRGHTVVVSGGPASTGAARLAARGALRGGAGLVTVASPPEALATNAAQLTAIMVKAVDGAAGLNGLLADPRLNAVVVGPGAGVGHETERMVEVSCAAKRATVLDADALTCFAGNVPGLWQVVDSARPAPVVLTPHEGEFSRIFSDEETVSGLESKLERSRCAAERTGAVVVLKGPDTVVAAPDGRAVINENSTPYLATAGSGDVLAGIIAGLLAQGMPSFEAASAAVWMHGEAGRNVGPGLIAEDLPEALPGVLRKVIAAA
jgi:ADP-dependent NAD(P)H-hydrate dehydratase / NAD(P)H-hydrate epimerase